MLRRARVLPILLVLVAGCAADPQTQSGSHRATATVEDDGVHVTLNEFAVSGPSTARIGSTLVVVDDVPADQSVIGENVPWLEPLSPTVQITFGADQQPGTPLTLAYRIPDEAQPPTGAVPVVVSRGADGSGDVIEARLDNRTVVAEIDHLSWFEFAWFSPDTLTTRLEEFVKPIFGLGSPKPDCVGQTQDFAMQYKTVTPVDGDVAWTCIMTTPGSHPMEPLTSIQLTVNSPFAWRIAASPPPTQVVTLDTDSANEYLRALYEQQTGTDLVAGPGDTVRLDFGPYTQSARTGTLTRTPEQDAIALTAWAYNEALTELPPFAGVFGALDIGSAVMKCSGTRTGSGLDMWGADLASCVQGLGSSAVRLMIGKTAVALGAYLTQELHNIPTSVQWAVDTTRTTSGPAPRADATVNTGASGGSSDEDVVLGRSEDRNSVGYGTARPASLSINSLCANTIIDVTWDSWGEHEAIGHGVKCAPAGSPESGGPVTLTATDLGDCYGTQAYRQLLVDGRPAWTFCAG